jgi:integrase
VSEYWEYQVYVPDATGKLKREWRNAPSRKAAEEARTERRAEIKQGTAVSASKLTLAAYLADWLPKHAVRRQLRPTTRASYETIIKERITSRLGGILLQRLTEQHIEDFVYQLQTVGRGGKPFSGHSVRNTMVVLREALQQARKTRLIPRNPCAEIDGPTIESKQMRQWTPAQAKSFLGLLTEERYRVLFVVTLTTGLRRGEAIGLRWEDVDFEQRWLHVRQNITDVNGHLNKGKPKTPSGQRDVKLPPSAVPLLLEHRKRQLEQRLAAGSKWEGAGEFGDLVFTTGYGKPLHPRNVYRRLTQLIQRAGLPHTGLHGLRRTASSIAHDGTKDMLAVAQMLGHAAPDITAKHYTKASEDAADRTADAIERALFGEETT